MPCGSAIRTEPICANWDTLRRNRFRRPPPAKFAVTTAIRIQYQQLQQQLTTRLYGIQWLPDSKHALFVRGNEVYEVDIE